jgi:multiple sugar transport system permease protein
MRSRSPNASRRVSRLRQLVRRAGLYVLVAAAAGFAALPVYWMLVTAMQRGPDLYSWPPHRLPNPREIGVFYRLFTTQPIGRWLFNSAVVGCGTASLSVALSILGAYSLSRFRYRGRTAFSFLLLLTQMLPSAVLIVPLFIIFREARLLNTRLALILADTAVIAPITVWILKTFFDTVPEEIEEAGLTDGCSRLGVLRRITLPLSTPALVAAFAIAFFEAWNEFVFALTFVSDQSLWVTSVGLASWIGYLTTPVEIMMSGAVVFTLPSILLFLVLQRQLISGLAAGGIR